MPRRASHTAAGAADPAPAVRLAPSWHVAPGWGPPPLLSACGRARAPAAEHRGAGARARQRTRNGTGAKMARCALCRMRSRHRRPSARTTNSIPWHASNNVAGTEASVTCIRPLGRSAVGGRHLFGGQCVLSSRAPLPRRGCCVVAGRNTRLEFRGASSPLGMLRMRMHNTRLRVAARPMARVRARALVRGGANSRAGRNGGTGARGGGAGVGLRPGATTRRARAAPGAAADLRRGVVGTRRGGGHRGAGQAHGGDDGGARGGLQDAHRVRRRGVRRRADHGDDRAQGASARRASRRTGRARGKRERRGGAWRGCHPRVVGVHERVERVRPAWPEPAVAVAEEEEASTRSLCGDLTGSPYAHAL